MKKNKTFILLIVTLVIWSIIGYQIYISLFSKPDRAVIIPSARTVNEKEAPVDYKLILNYPDPFLKNQVSKKTQEIRPKIAKPASEKIEQLVPLDWGKIVFYGILKNNSSTHIIASLSYNGNDYFVAKGDMIGSIQVHHITPDSVGLLQNGELKYFWK